MNDILPKIVKFDAAKTTLARRGAKGQTMQLMELLRNTKAGEGIPVTDKKLRTRIKQISRQFKGVEVETVMTNDGAYYAYQTAFPKTLERIASAKTEKAKASK